jgi:hypothetical protein
MVECTAQEAGNEEIFSSGMNVKDFGVEKGTCEERNPFPEDES